MDRNPIISLVVANHLWIEHLLIRCLTTVLQRPDALLGKNKRSPQFATLVDIAEAVEVVQPDFASVLRQVNSLRNKFAHRLAFDAQIHEIESLQKAVRKLRPSRHVSFVPASERELAIMLAVISGTLELRAKELGASDIGER